MNDDVVGGSTDAWISEAPEVLVGVYQVQLRTLDRFVRHRINDPFFSAAASDSPAS